MERKSARPIMIQGTMSNAGKSMLCTALCRIFAQDGYRVAPFKSQNMALNSYVTKEGLEMGRAQVAQAEAAYQEPSVRMNPILLKPTTDVGSQVIVHGKSVGNMRAREYFKYKKELVPEILRAYEELAAENDIIVIEGAGSPVELNLKSNDIVNMGLAKMVDAPVILVGDIDLGGVFAQIYGTVALLENDERDRLKAFIVNKFRGDPTLFEDGVIKLEELTGKPCAGVTPYVRVDIDDEDSQSVRLTEGSSRTASKEVLEIAVIRLPRMSNYTDFNALSRHAGVRVRFVDRAEQFGTPDALILPGTKSTLADRKWLRESGMEERILRFAETGAPVLGICGGLQLLGRTIRDPYEAEGGGEEEGLGLLELHTVFEQEKTLTRKQCVVSGLEGMYREMNGCKVSGYEMHMGASNDAAPFVQRENVLATYLHGCFDDGLDLALLQLLCRRKGISSSEILGPTQEDYAAYKNRQYDLLANAMRDSLDMELIYRIVFGEDR